MAWDQTIKRSVATLRRKPQDVVLIVVLSAAILALVNVYLKVNPDDVDWEHFKVTHACKLENDEAELHRSSWLCNDGQRYYRWRQQR